MHYVKCNLENVCFNKRKGVEMQDLNKSVTFKEKTPLELAVLALLTWL